MAALIQYKQERTNKMALTAKLTRSQQKTQTLGRLEIYEGEKLVFICDTIELPWKENQRQVSCIPTGTYRCVYRESEKYPQHYILQNVPNRDFILIHQANYVGSPNPRTRKPDLLGCIGVGNGYSDLNGDGIVELTRSVVTLKKMIEVLNKRPFTLTIV